MGDDQLMIELFALADNLFVEAQTRAYIHKHDATGADNLIAKHEDIGVETRLTIQRIGGTLPENLSMHRQLGIRDVLALDDASMEDSAWHHAPPTVI